MLTPHSERETSRTSDIPADVLESVRTLLPAAQLSELRSLATQGVTSSPKRLNRLQQVYVSHKAHLQGMHFGHKAV